ncbi:glycosyltransferase family 2 protein [Streptomyces fuscigenes]|uniref:glycosyltransferase family 2 protein n=1 Tax=Streptomyces fuscigenes TaxID=1528880 RepID=UPI001F3DDF23|nr:glycosyltransferase [Streptomyces fuscigenes]MCF3965065.1 glycosyltransferase [Streptomyces fuscigenes]
MSVKVSVVIPVYNPGPYIEDCIASLLRQSLPDDAYEAIFVDDGSSDGTPERLDRLAAEHPHMHVVHQEPSGWSGRPRNVGTDRARGEFVMYVDNDDWLGDEALERMYDYGVANGADIVVGKMAGKGRPVPLELFRVNRPKANVDNAPLIDSLTPHKMFRKEFLEKHHIRFKEGKRRLEDHVFLAEAYLLASSVAVLSDYVCYYHVKRDDASNAGFQRFDPVGYFKNLREALDVVERLTEPGRLRDKLYRRWLRNEMVERLRAQRFLALPEDYRKELFDEIRAVVTERMGPGVAAGLQPTQQVTAALITTDRFEDLEAYARWEAGIKPTGRLESLEWDDEGRLAVGLTAEFQLDGSPLPFRTAGGEPRLELPFDAATTDVLREAGANIRATVDQARVGLVVRERSSAAEFYQPVDFTVERVPVGPQGADGVGGEGKQADGAFRMVLRARATLDPETATGGGPLGAGIWDVYVRIIACGWSKAVRFGSVRDETVDKSRRGALSGSPRRLVLPYWTEGYGNLSLDVDCATNWIGKDLAPLGPQDLTVRENRLRFPVPLHTGGEEEALLRFRPVRKGGALEAHATLAPGEGGAVLAAPLPAEKLARGVWTIDVGVPSARRGGAPRWTPLSVGVKVRADGRASFEPAASLTRSARPRSLPRRIMGRVRRMFSGA